MNLAALSISAALIAMPMFAQDTKERVFWKWFEENQEALFNFETNREAVFNRLSKAFEKVDADLTFEFGPVQQDGTREFVISAAGIKRAFPRVEALYAAAPKLPRWVIVKYRPRRFPINDVEFGGRKVKARDVHFAIFKDADPKKLGIMVFLDGYDEQQRSTVWGQIGYLLLDEALGEYDVETHVGAIVFFNHDSKYFRQARPLSELPTCFDEQLGKNKISEPGGPTNGSQPIRSDTNRTSSLWHRGRSS